MGLFFLPIIYVRQLRAVRGRQALLNARGAAMNAGAWRLDGDDLASQTISMATANQNVRLE